MSYVAVTQFCGTNVIATNLKICSELIYNVAKRGVKASDFIGINNEETLKLTNENNFFVDEMRKQAINNKVWISIGIHETSPTPKHIYNTHLIISSNGEIVSRYHKLHLFDINIKNSPVLIESSTTLRGDKIIDPVESPIGKIGMMICYDLRFPELSLTLRKRGAEVLTYPSAFTVKTGMAHWDVLLRARAIETQSYVIASAHIGQHNEKRESFGSAMIVDPWGTVLAKCPETTKPTFALAEIDLDRLKQLRINMPVIEHRDELQLEKYSNSSNNENDTEKEVPDKIMGNFMEKCHEIKNRAKELLEKAKKKDGTEIKLDYNIKIQIIRGFIYMKRVNSEAYFRKRDEKNAKNKAKYVLTDAKHRFSEINYRKFLLDYELNAIKSDEPKYHKISLKPLEEFLNTAPQEFIEPLRKYHDFADIT
ncbi:6291_t:CDS:10 [Diversispora eburnea]|uniref:6291_t:CDS:1 n=1 Tax=Diversispora eburnea TaxID=1213867 RepID=A0A9N8YM85_9GLOM|nr:6291_t:CDS:10 [Diversispora eburnea]